MGFPCENPNFSPFRINLCAVEHSSVLRRFDNKLIQALTWWWWGGKRGFGFEAKKSCLFALEAPQVEVELFLGSLRLPQS